MFTIQTVGRSFALDLDQVKQHIEDNYGFSIKSNFGNVLKGDVNINFALDTTVGKKIVRIYGAYSEYTERELQIMQFLADHSFPTSRPLSNIAGGVVTEYETYQYSVFDFITGERPLYTPEAFSRVGRSVAKLQQLLLECPVKLERENRYLQIFNRKDELANYLQDNLSLAKQILSPAVYQTIPEQIDLLRNAKLPTYHTQLIHGDIYSSNVIDNGNEAAIIDFEWVAQGPSIIDPLLYIAWDGVCNSRATNTPSVYRKTPYLFAEQIKAYLSGYRKAGGNTAEINDPAILELLIFLNIGDNMFNLEIAIKAGQNLFQDYLNSYNSATVIRQNTAKIQKIISDAVA